MITSSPGGRRSVVAISPNAFSALVLIFLLRLGRGIWCDVSRRSFWSPVASQLRTEFSVARGRHAKQKRGTGCAPFCLRYARSAAFPQRTHLTQRRDYDNILWRVVHRDFGLALAPG